MDCTREEFLSGARDWRAATPPGHRHLDERAIRQILETGRADPFEKEFLRKDGTRVPVRLTAAPLPGQAGRVVVGIEDLSARREADAALRESEARFRLVAESAPVMLWMGDREGGCVYLNRALRAFWGVAPDAMAGFDWSATLHPEDRDALLAPFGRAMRARIGFTVEARFRRADGEYHVLRAEARPRFGPGGEFLGMIGVNVDVTETRRAEAALREGQARLRDLLATLDLTTVMARDLDGTVRFWSAGCERLYGWTAAEAAGRVAHALLETRFPVPLPEIEAALLRDGEWRGDLRQRRRDGSEVVVSAHKSLRRAAGGRPVAVAESLTDVTALRRAEEQQALLARELDHRAKNALAVVQAAVRLTPKDDPAAFARAVEGRVAALARAHTMLAEGQWRGAALRPLIEAELAAFLPGETVVSDRSAPPRVEVAGPDLALAPVAMQALSMAVHELATNAVKYGGLSASGGRVRVSWHVDGAAGLLRLRWEEAGGPPIAGPPARRGFGSRVLEATVRDQLGGQVERLWGPSGLVCEIAIPVERTVVAVAGRRPGGAAAG
jgi:PAS domain S-box-containing protein